MKIVMLACTVRACQVMQTAASALREAGESVETHVKCSALPELSMKGSLSEAVRKWFGEADALVFFAATGIAVRLIAPCVRDKLADPAVLVVDETGRFCISLLSGHAGGANALTERLAEMIGAEPVITTATDREGLFSVDAFAVSHGLAIGSREKARQISADLLRGRACRIWVEDFCERGIPSGRETEALRGKWLRLMEEALQETGAEAAEALSGADAAITPFADLEDNAPLALIPKCVTLGIGCRRGMQAEEIEAVVSRVLEERGLLPESILGVASVDRKADEAGLLAFCGKWRLPFSTFTAEELMEVPGAFTASAFVRQTVGVDNVCERSAVRLAEGGPLLTSKVAVDGVTVALALMA